jgi:cystathionine beta-lyase
MKRGSDASGRGGRDVRTALVSGGRDAAQSLGFVNLPPFRGSTVLHENAAAQIDHTARYTYGRHGNPTMEALETLWADLAGAAGAVICPSGANACSTALLALLSAGDHLLVTDSVYRPVRHFARTMLARLGIETTFFDPLIGAEIAALIRPNTRALYLDSPGSQTMELQDVDLLVAIAKDRGVLTLIDDTWGTPLLFDAMGKGIDVAIHAGTKYPSGHSDVLIGMIAANAAHFPSIKESHRAMGVNAAPDEIALTLRGLRTLPLRLEAQGAAALAVARWLAARPEVLAVWHPALEGSPGHSFFARDFKGAAGLFSFVLRSCARGAVESFLDALDLFGMGYSWGGYESLAIHFDARSYRTHWRDPGGPCIRLQIGLEALDDILADLDRGLAAWRKAGAG